MRKARTSLNFDPAAPVIRCHCHSAFNGPWEAFTDAEREQFLESVFTCAAFSGIEIVAFSIRPTSFDLLVDSPRVLDLTRREMLARLKQITEPAHFEALSGPLKAKDETAWSRLAARFGDVSTFIKQLKQLTTTRYHREHATRGTLWTGRYYSAYVQTGHASRILSAWFDHAAVRGGETTTVDQDRFSTFGRAVAGDERARAMIAALYAPDPSTSWRGIAKAYRSFITDDTLPPNARKSLTGIPLLTRSRLLLTEVPQFRGGVAIGDEAFTENFFQLNRNEFGPDRKRGGHPIGGQSDPDLWTIRQKTDLRKL
jgi:hypothetical protein